MSEHEYDVVVLGGGSSGENAAWYAINNGLSAAIVERDLVGGECTYWACMPSKALLRPGEVLAQARRVPGASPAVTGGVDIDRALRSRDAFAANWDDRYQVQWVEDAGADLIRGHGRLAGERAVEVSQQDGSAIILRAAKAVVIATGSRAAIPPIEGLRDIRVWDNRDITSAKQAPDRLLILGGGVVGVEMAQAWRWLGSGDVTIVEMADRLIPNEEPFASEQLQRALEDLGITVLASAKMVGVSRHGEDGPVTARLDDGSELVADELLVAVGRAPSTGDLGLETVGLEARGYLETDERLRVRDVEGGWLYAIGDANGKALLTHQGKYQARLVGDVIAGRDRVDIADARGVPRVIFTDPQIAAVGPTEAQARDAGRRVKTVRVDLASVAGGSLLGKGITGSAQLVIDNDRRIIVGATFTGPGVGELLHAATIAVIGEVPIDRLWHAVPAFPTVSEVWLRLLEADRGIT